MNIELSADTQARLDRILEGGDYPSAEAVVDEAIRLLAERREAFWAEVNRKVAEGLEDLRAGRFREATPALFDEIRERARLRLAAGQ